MKSFYGSTLVKGTVLLILPFTFLLIACKSNAQFQQLATALHHRYDSLKYLTFDVQYTYYSDSLNGTTVEDVMKGSYTLAGKKAKFNLGNIEFMQNDSFFISVYNDDHFIHVADPRSINAGNELPLRQLLDSLQPLLDSYEFSSSYGGLDTVSYSLVPLSFEFLDPDAGDVFFYNQIAVKFSGTDTLLYSVDYSYEEDVQVEEDTLGNPLPPVRYKKRLKVEFSNYRFDNFSDSVYDENNYIFLDNGNYKPITKYKDYDVHYSRSPSVRQPGVYIPVN